MTDHMPTEANTPIVPDAQAAAPVVSVLIPAYNHARYVRACLDSIRAAACCPIEILVLDDGSDDGTYEEVAQWMNEHGATFSRCLLEKRNRNGITKNLNYLCSIASGEYIIWIASDDILLPDGISSRLPLFEQWQAESIVGDAAIIDEHGETIFPSAYHDYQKMDIEGLKQREAIGPVLVKRWFVPGPCLMFKKSLLQKVGKLNESLVVEDRDFFLRILAQNRLAFFDHPVACYRIHRSNTSLKSRLTSKVRRDVFWSNWHNARLFHGTQRLYLLSYLYDWLLMRTLPGLPRLVFVLSAPAIILRKLIARTF